MLELLFAFSAMGLFVGGVVVGMWLTETIHDEDEPL